jgi:hypothetical protein
MHAVDWLPMALAAAGLPPVAGGKPLDGLNMWPALSHNGSSPRTSVYYGVTELYIGLNGPAVRHCLVHIWV